MRYIATGRVHPERCAVTFSRIEMSIPNGGKAYVSSDSSLLTIIIDDDDLDGRHAAVIQAEQLASLVVNVLAYSLGFGYRVEISQIVQEDGQAFVYGATAIADGASALGFEEYSPIFNRMLFLAGRDFFCDLP